MSPRRNRPKRRGPRAPEEEERPISPGIILAAPPGWHARAISRERALKEYLCPGCRQTIKPGVEHVVAWRSGQDEHRRHWHTRCWSTFVKQGGRFSTGEL